MSTGKFLWAIMLIPFLFGQSSFAQEAGSVVWKTKSQGRVYATPSGFNDKVCFGSMDGKMYVVERETGRQLFRYSATVPIKSKAVFFRGSLLFVGGNDLYCIDANTGVEKWIYKAGGNNSSHHLDDWDYHLSSVTIHKGTAYYGSGDGNVYAIDPVSGTLLETFPTTSGAPIHVTPKIYNEILYYGDWDGWIYAVNLISGESKWTHKTFSGSRPYASFGGIVGEIVVHKSMVFFGLRNSQLQVLDEQTGQLEWTYSDNNGGWISGDPVLEGNRLYIGGSDNHRFYCFDIRKGELMWHFDFFGNCFSKPLIVNDKIILTTGDGYANYPGNNGTGFIYVLAKDGNLENYRQFDGNIFSSPSICLDKICIGSDDGYLYALESIVLIDTPITGNPIKRLDQSFKMGVFPNPFTEGVTFSFNCPIQSDLRIHILDIMGKSVRQVVFPNLPAGTNQYYWNSCDDSGKPVQGKLFYCLVNQGGNSMTVQLIRTSG